MHESLEEFLKKYGDKTLYLATTKGQRSYGQASYEPGAMFLFGRETSGLPSELIRANEEKTIRIPMSAATRERSLNLSNSVAIVLFEALRQHGFPGME